MWMSMSFLKKYGRTEKDPEFLVAFEHSLGYTKVYPEMCDNPIILNLQLL